MELRSLIDKILCSNPEQVRFRLNEIISRIHFNGPIYPADFESLALIKLFHPTLFAEKEKEILYLSGLFYKVDEPQNLLEEVYSIFADAIMNETGKSFTPIQADAYKHIRDKRYFSFSAPTSAGKSYLFREIITETSGDIVIVLPSRALIAEYLNAVKAMVDNTVLVLQFIENINIAHVSRRVFIITPERGRELFKYRNVFNVELFLFDEAQLSEEEVRGIGFDAYVRRISREFPEATKVFAHPFVSNPEAQLRKHGFSDNSAYAAYNQNAVGRIFISVDKGDYYYFSPYHDKAKERVPVIRDHMAEILLRNGTILIYASKSRLYSGKYLTDYRHYLRFCPKLTDQNALDYVERLRDYIGASKSSQNKNSLLLALMERGIVLHHGSMPLKMRLIIEQFIRRGFARICFATSTLNQGINMPFDAVYIDNYTKMDVLTLKNLIGRAGRSTRSKNTFEFGYILINDHNVSSFSKRIDDSYELSEASELDADVVNSNEDDIDLIEAVTINSFDDDTRLTTTQIDRIRHGDVIDNAKLILDYFMIKNRVLTGKEYYEILSDNERKEIKDAFKALYLMHLRRSELTRAEQTILSTAIPILLWHIQGRTFKEILALRYSYLTQRSERRKILAKIRTGEITEEEGDEAIAALRIRFSQSPSLLPNKKARITTSFGKDKPVTDLDYDTLVFDTYDYLDKVISLSLSDPLCAAFRVYYEKTGDPRALSMVNYIRHGTNDTTEIWLLRYGFAFEDIEWIKPFVKQVDENGIDFADNITDEDQEHLEIVKRYR